MSTAEASLRDEQVARTRQRVLEAAVELLSTANAAELTMPAVAARSGVSLRTVYRHFPTKETLLDGIAHFGDEQTRSAYPPDRFPFGDLDEFIASLWGELAERREWVRAQHMTPTGIGIRRSRIDRRLDVIDRILDEERLDLDPDDRQRLQAVIAVLVSSSALLEFTDLLGVSVEDAARMTTWATRAVIEKAKRTKEVARP